MPVGIVRNEHCITVLDSNKHKIRYDRSEMTTIGVFHTHDQNHVTAGATPFWRSSFATAAVAAVDSVIETSF